MHKALDRGKKTTREVGVCIRCLRKICRFKNCSVFKKCYYCRKNHSSTFCDCYSKHPNVSRSTNYDGFCLLPNKNELLLIMVIAYGKTNLDDLHEASWLWFTHILQLKVSQNCNTLIFTTLPLKTFRCLFLFSTQCLWEYCRKELF